MPGSNSLTYSTSPENSSALELNLSNSLEFQAPDFSHNSILITKNGSSSELPANSIQHTAGNALQVKLPTLHSSFDVNASSAIYLVSVGSENFMDLAVLAMVKLIQSIGFKKLTIVIADTLQAHNFVALLGITLEQARELTRLLGAAWVNVYKPLIEKRCPELKINFVHWDQLLKHPLYFDEKNPDSYFNKVIKLIDSDKTHTNTIQENHETKSVELTVEQWLKDSIAKFTKRRNNYIYHNSEKRNIREFNDIIVKAYLYKMRANSTNTSAENTEKLANAILQSGDISPYISEIINRTLINSKNYLIEECAALATLASLLPLQASYIFYPGSNAWKIYSAIQALLIVPEAKERAIKENKSLNTNAILQWTRALLRQCPSKNNSAENLKAVTIAPVTVNADLLILNRGDTDENFTSPPVSPSSSTGSNSSETSTSTGSSPERSETDLENHQKHNRFIFFNSHSSTNTPPNSPIQNLLTTQQSSDSFNTSSEMPENKKENLLITESTSSQPIPIPGSITFRKPSSPQHEILAKYVKQACLPQIQTLLDSTIKLSAELLKMSVSFEEANYVYADVLNTVITSTIKNLAQESNNKSTQSPNPNSHFASSSNSANISSEKIYTQLKLS